MKKMMIALAVVAMAMCSQAASIKWRCVNLTDYDGNKFSGSVLLTNDLGVGEDSGTAASGAIAYRTVTSSDLEVGSTYGFYITYTDAKGNVFTSTAKPTKMQEGSTPALTFNMSGTWTPAPEPTSGILLLLGMAGLALKRRRA